MFQVKRIQPLEDLITESDLIKIGSEIDQAVKSSEGGSTDPKSSTDNWSQVDYLIDQLLERGIVDIAQDLKRPILEKELGTEFSKEKIKKYLAYCKQRNLDLSKELQTVIAQDPIDDDRLQELMAAQIRIAARIQVLERIYQAFKLTNKSEIAKIADEVLQQISMLKTEFANSYGEIISKFGSKIRTEISHIEDADTQEEGKIWSAEKVLSAFDSMEPIIIIYPPEMQEGMKHAKAKAEQTIKQEIGEENFNGIREQILSNKQEAVILQRIVAMKYMYFKSEDEIHKEADRIKQQINGLRGSRRNVYKYHSESSQEVIDYLTKELAQAVDELLKKVKDKSLTLDKAKGIRYDFKTTLKLHELTNLPVTGKQIAEASLLMKLRKAMSSIFGLIPSGEVEMSPAGRAWAEFGEQTHKTYAKVLNTGAKFIGRLFGGRSGEMKADAISRMFIPGPGVLDKNKPTVPTSVFEEGGAPGVAMQVPGSISGMGPIVAPTPTSLGSGDNFNPQKKKKKKKKSIYEERMEIMNFASFLKENNDR